MAARAPANYALKPLESIGVTKVRVGRTDVKLVRFLGRIPGIRFTPLREVKKLLRSKSGSRLSVCGAELECVTDFGKALRVKYVVAGDMTQLGKGYVLSLKLVNVSKGKVVRRITVVVRGRKLEREQSLVEASYKLLAPKHHTGGFQVAVDVRGGVLQLSNSSFWGFQARNVRVDGPRSIASLGQCVFLHWDRARTGRPSVEALGGSLTVQGCAFRQAQPHIALGEGVSTAAIFGNTFTGEPRIARRAKGDVSIHGNVSTPSPPR